MCELVSLTQNMSFPPCEAALEMANSTNDDSVEIGEKSGNGNLSLPYLMPELWVQIFQRTNLWTCLENRHYEAANLFLQGKIAKDAALRQAVKSGKLIHLKLLISKFHLSRSDVRHARESKINLPNGGEGSSEFELSLVGLAVKHGKTAILKWLVEQQIDEFCSDKILDHLLKHGPNAAFHFLYRTRPHMFTEEGQEKGDILKVAASGHQLSIVKHLLKHSSFSLGQMKRSAHTAAYEGRAKALKALLKKSPECLNEDILHEAIYGGHKNIVEWLYQHHRRVFTFQAVIEATDPDWGDLGILQWMHDHDLISALEMNRRLSQISSCCPKLIAWMQKHYPHVELFVHLEDACFFHSFKKLQALYHSGAKIGAINYAIQSAAEQGGVRMVEWLHKHQFVGSFNTDAMDFAKDFETVKYLHEHLNASCTSVAMDKAALYGNLSTLKYLKEHTATIATEEAMHNAATEGHLEIVKWLHDAEYQCRRETIGNAIWKGNKEMTAWLWQNMYSSKGCEPSAKVVTDSGEQMSLKQWLEKGGKDTLESLILLRARRWEPPYEHIKCFPHGFSLAPTLQARVLPEHCFFYSSPLTMKSLELSSTSQVSLWRW